jgi:hypothetical protein
MYTLFVLNPTRSWGVELGSSNHICNMLQEFQETRLNNGEMYLSLEDEVIFQILAIGFL